MLGRFAESAFLLLGVKAAWGRHRTVPQAVFTPRISFADATRRPGHGANIGGASRNKFLPPGFVQGAQMTHSVAKSCPNSCPNDVQMYFLRMPIKVKIN